ncbi:MAG: response regulator [Sphingomonadaceae bacterium]
MPPAIHILVVDDFATMRRVIVTLLRELGFAHVSEAEDGAKALRLLQAKEGAIPINCVMTDLNMPVMNGIELLQQIRASIQFEQMPVLMVTAESKREDIVAAAQAGADGYIIKPFNSATLKDKLARVFAKRGLA